MSTLNIIDDLDDWDDSSILQQKEQFPSNFPGCLGVFFFCPFGTVRCLLYRSLFYAGADFMALQWDALLHEDS